MGLLVAWKNEEDPIKHDGARVITTLFINFSDAQGQLTLKSVMESCWNSNSSELLLLVLLSASVKKIHQTSSPMGKECSPESQQNVWRYHNLWCSKAGNSELDTLSDQELIKKHKILCQSWLSASFKKIWITRGPEGPEALTWSP